MCVRMLNMETLLHTSVHTYVCTIPTLTHSHVLFSHSQSLSEVSEKADHRDNGVYVSGKWNRGIVAH